jgi:hypothetical protein
VFINGRELHPLDILAAAPKAPWTGSASVLATSSTEAQGGATEEVNTWILFDAGLHLRVQ